MATITSILACRIQWTEEPGGLHPQRHKELDTTEATEHAVLGRVIPFKIKAPDVRPSRIQKIKYSQYKIKKSKSKKKKSDALVIREAYSNGEIHFDNK